jgi:hypothetical protein
MNAGAARNGIKRVPYWLPNMDLNHDKQIQSLLCYHYTIRQCEWRQDSRFQFGVKDAQNGFQKVLDHAR